MTDLKYSLKKLGFFSSHYLLQALRDIPEHGVKAGDFGGIVNKQVKLSHQGSCWIGRHATVIGNVEISGNAYVGGHATVFSSDDAKIIIKDSARIFDEARVNAKIVYRSDAGKKTTFSGNAQIFGKTVLKNVSEVSGDAKVYGSATLYSWVSVTGTSEVSGNVRLGEEVVVSGNSKLTDNVRVDPNAIIHDSYISGSVVVTTGQTIENGAQKNVIAPSGIVFPHETTESIMAKTAGIIAETDKTIEKTAGIMAKTDRIIAQTANIMAHSLTAEHLDPQMMGYAPESANRVYAGKPQAPAKKPEQVNEAILSFREVMDNIASYETDIVKIIQYPVMTDRTDSYTRAMVSAVNKAKRYLGDPESDAFKDAVLNLEDAFLAAESNARKLASTLFSDAEKKQAEKAKDLLAMAANEAASEQEKKNAFKQGFKQLEGIIDVPEVAVDTFRMKIGLKELQV